MIGTLKNKKSVLKKFFSAFKPCHYKWLTKWHELQELN